MENNGNQKVEGMAQENKPITESSVAEKEIPAVPYTPIELSEIEKAEVKIKQLDELNRQLAEKLAKVDKMQAEVMLRGRSLIGTPQETEEEKKNKAAMKLIEGTGLRLNL